MKTLVLRLLVMVFVASFAPSAWASKGKATNALEKSFLKKGKKRLNYKSYIAKKNKKSKKKSGKFLFFNKG